MKSNIAPACLNILEMEIVGFFLGGGRPGCLWLSAHSCTVKGNSITERSALSRAFIASYYCNTEEPATYINISC